MDQPTSDEQFGWSDFAVGIVVAAFFLAPFFLQLNTLGILTDARGAAGFDNAAIGILGALVIAIALQVGVAVDLLWKFFGRGDYVFLAAILFGYLATLISGGAAALSALQTCSPKGICGSPEDLNNVIFALISGTTLMATLFTASIYHRLTELKRQDEAKDLSA
jgi:hypothetical protein